MAYTYTEYPDHDALAEGELLVENAQKGVWQIVPCVERPYLLLYCPSNNNVYAARSFTEFEQEPMELIKVVD